MAWQVDSSSKKILECPLCGYSTEAQYRMVRHFKVHEKVHRHRCNRCSFAALSRAKLEYHVVTEHHQQLRYECDQCDYSCVCAKTLQVHIKTKHKPEDQFDCVECGFPADSRLVLFGHMLSEHDIKPEGDSQFLRCCECDYKTSRKYDLQRHFVSKHLHSIVYQCELCDFTTDDKKSLKRHVSDQHSRDMLETRKSSLNTKKNPKKPNDEREQIFYCKRCKYRTSKRGALNNHNMIKHRYVRTNKNKKSVTMPTTEKEGSIPDPDTRDESQFYCSSCEYQTSEKKYFQRHLLTSRHMKQISMESNEVGKSTTKQVPKKPINKTKLKVSSGRRGVLHQCPKCTFTTRWQHSILRHMFRKHQNKNTSKPTLNKAPIKLSSKRDQNSMVVIKKEEKSLPTTPKKAGSEFSKKKGPFNCIYCSFKTKYRQNLQRHINTAHPEEENPVQKIHTYKTSKGLKDSSKIEDASAANTSSGVNTRSSRGLSTRSSTVTPKTENSPQSKRSSNASKKMDLECTKCSFIASEKYMLKRHKISKHLVCHSCPFEAIVSSELSEHLLSEHGSFELFSCSDCGFFSVDNRQFKKHMQKNHHKKAFNCVPCNFMTNSSKLMMDHFLAEHIKKEIDDTNSCVESSNLKEEIDDTNSCVESSNLKEEIDDTNSCVESSNLKEEMVHNYNQITNRDLSNDDCNRNVDGHSESVLDDIDSKGVILNCDNTNSSPFKISEDMVSSGNELPETSAHSGTCKGGYVCQHCDFSSLDANALKDHILNEHPSVEPDSFKPSQCSECSFKSQSIGQLRRHILINHFGVQSYHCPQCDYKADQHSVLQKHISRQHGKKNPPKKLVQNKPTNKKVKKGLKNKITTNVNKEGVVPQDETPNLNLICVMCGYSSPSSITLAAHKQIEHPTTARQLCLLCFNEYMDIWDHLFIMHKPPFKCFYCDLSFQHYAVLCEHIKKIHLPLSKLENSNKQPNSPKSIDSDIMDTHKDSLEEMESLNEIMGSEELIDIEIEKSMIVGKKECSEEKKYDKNAIQKEYQSSLKGKVIDIISEPELENSEKKHQVYLSQHEKRSERFSNSLELTIDHVKINKEASSKRKFDDSEEGIQEKNKPNLVEDVIEIMSESELENDEEDALIMVGTNEKSSEEKFVSFKDGIPNKTLSNSVQDVIEIMSESELESDVDNGDIDVRTNENKSEDALNNFALTIENIKANKEESSKENFFVNMDGVQKKNQTIECVQKNEVFEINSSTMVDLCESSVESTYSCVVCGYLCTDEELLTAHRESEHQTSPGQVCAICLEECIDLWCHITTRHKPSLACTTCGKSFPYYTQLCEHVASSHVKTNLQIVDISSLTRQKSVLASTSQTSSIKECNKRPLKRKVDFSKGKNVSQKKSVTLVDNNAATTAKINPTEKYTLIKHIKRQKQNVQCPYCSLKYMNFLWLEKHVWQNHSANYEEFKNNARQQKSISTTPDHLSFTQLCAICLEYIGSFVLEHVAKEHKPPFKCIICQIETRYYSELSYHMKNTHIVTPDLTSNDNTHGIVFRKILPKPQSSVATNSAHQNTDPLAIGDSTLRHSNTISQSDSLPNESAKTNHNQDAPPKQTEKEVEIINNISSESICAICLEKCDENILDHVSNNHRHPPFACVICHKTFLYYVQLSKHLQTIHVMTPWEISEVKKSIKISTQETVAVEQPRKEKRKSKPKELSNVPKKKLKTSHPVKSKCKLPSSGTSESLPVPTEEVSDNSESSSDNNQPHEKMDAVVPAKNKMGKKLVGGNKTAIKKKIDSHATSDSAPSTDVSDKTQSNENVKDTGDNKNLPFECPFCPLRLEGDRLLKKHIWKRHFDKYEEFAQSLLTDSVSSPPADDDSSLPPEDVSLPMTENVSLPTTENVSSPPTENVSSPPAENVSKLPAEIVSSLPPENVSLPMTETVSLPTTENVSSPPTENVSSPPAENVSEPPTETVSSLPPENVSLPMTENVSSPTTNNVSSPPTENVSLPPSEIVSSPPADDISSLPPENVSLPMTENVSSPTTNNVSSPPTENVSLPPSEIVYSPPADDISLLPPENVSLPMTENVSYPPSEIVSSPPIENVSSPPTEKISSPPPENISFPSNDNVSPPPTENVPLLPIEDVLLSPSGASPDRSPARLNYYH